PQLESKLFPKPDGADWITPWGEKITFFNKQHKNNEKMIELYKELMQGTGCFTPYADFEAEGSKNGNWVVSGKDTKAGWSFEYSNGRLLKITAPTGRFLQFQYIQDKLTAVTENNVTLITLSYNPQSVVADKLTINGVDLALTYSQQSNLSLDKNKLEPAVRVNNQMLASITRGSLNPIVFSYDADGYLAGIAQGGFSEKLAVQHETEQERHAFIKKIQEMKEKKQNTVYVIPDKLAGRILKDEFYTYSYPEKNVVVLHDKAGRQAAYNYSDLRGILKVNDFAGLETSTYYFRRYDVSYNGKIRQVVDAKDRVVLNCRYDKTTGELSRVRDMADNETYYAYDKNGWLASVSRSVPGGKQPLLRINYDPRGNPVEYLRLDAEGKVATTTKLSYNSNRDLTSVDNGEQSMNFSYNNFGKPTQTTDIFNRAAKFEYDKYNRLKAATAPTGIRTVYTYTPAGMISEIKRFSSLDEKELLSSLKITYDADGRAVSYTDNQGRMKKLEHDSMGRVIAEYFPDNTAVKYSYSVFGQLHKVTDQNKNPIEFEWTKFGSLGEKKTAENQATDYNYDKYGLLQSVISKLKSSKTADREIKYAYDAFDRVTSIDYGNGQIKTFKYDSWGKVLQTTQAEGKKVSTADFQYDQFDRLVKKTVTVNGVPQLPGSVATGSNGGLASVTTGSSGEAGNSAVRRTDRTDYEYAYDRYGKRTERLITFSDGQKRKSEWVYDKYGRLTAMNDEGKTVSYAYDNQSRIAVRKADNIPVYYTYTRFGQLETKSLGSPFAFSGDSKPIAYIKYFYSPDGQITARDVSGNKQDYKYDRKGQLLEVVDATGKAVEQYVYDAAGNILSKTIDGKTTTFKYDKANQLVSSNNAVSRTDYEYDAAGRLTKEGDKSYAYGWLDKVVNVSENGKLAASFDYGIDGQIANRTDATGKSESFTWDGLALIKRDSTNFVNESAVTGGNPILAFGKDSSKVLFEDMLGSSVGSVENGKFNAINRTAFGELESDDSNIDFFTGKPQVEGLGYAFLFRNYRADQGKWQTADLKGYPDGWNNLAYVNNRTVGCIDWRGAEMVTIGFDATINGPVLYYYPPYEVCFDYEYVTIDGVDYTRACLVMDYAFLVNYTWPSVEYCRPDGHCVGHSTGGQIAFGTTFGPPVEVDSITEGHLNEGEIYILHLLLHSIAFNTIIEIKNSFSPSPPHASITVTKCE
ncbi:MAG: hypothetical protein WCI51_13545, partial [Lentisphaerota bacterium]